MRQFEFSLERIRNYKMQMLEKEKKTLASLKLKRDEIAQKICSMEKFRDEKTLQVQQKQIEGVSMSELVSLNFLIDNTRNWAFIRYAAFDTFWYQFFYAVFGILEIAI